MSKQEDTIHSTLFGATGMQISLELKGNSQTVLVNSVKFSLLG